MRRNATIELTRVIGCLLVIMLHIRLTSFKENDIVLSNFAINCITRDGVTLFWIIQGFLLNCKANYIDVLKRTLIKIITPAFLTMLFCSMLSKYAGGGIYLKSSLTDVLIAVTNWNASLIPYCPHLWYIFAYIQVILWYPLLNIGKGARRWVMGLMLVSVIINDMQQLYIPPIGKIVTYSVISESVFFVLIGCEIKEHFSTNKCNLEKIRYMGIMAFVMGNMMKGFLSILLYTKLGNYTSEYFLGTGTFFSIISATGLFLFINSYVLYNKAGKLFVFLGRHTYYIYLFHWLIKDILAENGIDRWFMNAFESDGLGNIMYHIIYTISIFTICLVISIVIQQLLFYIKRNFLEIAIKSNNS